MTKLKSPTPDDLNNKTSRTYSSHSTDEQELCLVFDLPGVGLLFRFRLIGRWRWGEKTNEIKLNQIKTQFNREKIKSDTRNMEHWKHNIGKHWNGGSMMIQQHRNACPNDKLIQTGNRTRSEGMWYLMMRANNGE